MSNYYSYYCVDCDESCRPGNHKNKHDDMCAVLRYKKELVALNPLRENPSVWSFELQLSDGHWIPFDFLTEHVEHRLVVMSEYKDHYYEPDETLVKTEI